MTKILFAVLSSLFILIAPLTHAADIQQEQKSLLDQVNNLTSEYNGLKAERLKLAKRMDVLQDAQGMIVKQMAKYKTDRTSLDMRFSSQEAFIQEHNSHCTGTSSDAARVSACNAEAAQLDATSKQLDQANNALNANLGLIKTAIQTEGEETEKVVAADKAAMDRENEIVILLKPLLQRLQAIQAQVDDCKKAIADVDAAPDKIDLKEVMHAHCGAMFDGNTP